MNAKSKNKDKSKLSWYSALLIKIKRLHSFLMDAKQELEKVVWPNRQETIQTTSIVVLMVTVAGFFLWGIDSAMLWAIGKITHLG